MVSKNTTLISVSKSTKESLDKLKLHPSLSYNDVVVMLAGFYRMNNPLFVVKEEIPSQLPTILDAEKLCYFCNAVEVIDETWGKIIQHEISCNSPKTSTSTGN